MNKIMEKVRDVFDIAVNEMTEKEFQKFANDIIRMLRDEYDVAEEGETNCD